MATAATTPLVNEPIKLTRAVKPKAGTKGAPIPPPLPPPPSVSAPLSATPSAPVAAVAAAAATAAPESPAVTFASVFTKLAVGMARFKEITSDLKILQKETARIAKESVRRPRRVADPSAEPSGFRKPVGLSPEMATFVGVDLEAKVSRNNVTKAVTTYIKAHNLQDTPDKRVILPDANLRALLGIEDQKLTYFNLQSFLKKHFLKAQPEATPAVPAVPVLAPASLPVAV